MNYEDLEYFIAVVQSGSLTRAAKQLGITQPSISKAIGRVEEAVGACLFTRSGNHIQLNQYGKKYYKAALESQGLLGDALDEIRDCSGNIPLTIRIATTVNGFMDPLLELFHQEHPSYGLWQYLLPQDVLVDMLRSGKIDFAFSTTPIYENGITWTPLYTDDLYVLVSPDHPLYGIGSASLAQFAGDPIVINNSGSLSNDDVYQFCRQAGFEPNVVYAGGEAEIIAQLIEQNAVSFIAHSTIERMARRLSPQTVEKELRNPPKVYIKIVDSFCSRKYGFAYLNAHYRSPAAEIFFEKTNSHFSSRIPPRVFSAEG